MLSSMSKAVWKERPFEIPADPVTIDQKGCWFRPRVMGIQVGQPLEVINSDPVTHNIHPMAADQPRMEP